MGVYSDLFATNGSGWHSFDGTVLQGRTVVTVSGDADGERITVSGILADVLLHRNGRLGERDLARDTLRVPIERLASLGEAVQALLVAAEQVPGGRRT